MGKIQWEHMLSILGAEGAESGPWVQKIEAERNIRKAEDAIQAKIQTSLANANRNNDLLAARVRVLEGEKQALESRIVEGARREARQNEWVAVQKDEIIRLKETQIPTLNTIQKARYKHGTRFDQALGLKGDESLEAVIPRVIDAYMDLDEGWKLFKENATTLDRIRARCDKAYAGTGPCDTEECVDNLATAFEAVKVRLGTAVDALQQVQIATTPQPQLDFKIKWHPPLGGYPAGYLFTGV